MARNMKPFDLDASPARDRVEDIYLNGTIESPMPPVGVPVMPQVAAVAPSTPITPATDPTTRPVKTEKAIKASLPMAYYSRLARLKECTGKTLQELTLQALTEFIDRNYPER